MGFFNFFKHRDDVSKASKKQKSVGSSKKATSLASTDNSLDAPQLLGQKSKNVLCVEKYVERANRNDIHGVKKLVHSSKSKFIFEDAPPIPLCQLDWLVDLHRSFPDFKITYTSMSEPEPDVVCIDGWRVEGTHTGEPYSCLPGVFPAIEATGIKCVNDDERLWIEMKEHKMDKIHVLAVNGTSGCSGFYEQIGGSMVPPEKN